MKFPIMNQDKPPQTSGATIQATVRGHVQGVFFRAFVRNHAERLGLGGYVRNQPDGSVYVEAYGDRAKLEELLRLIRRGPERAHVTIVEHELLETDTQEGASHFEVKH